MTNQAADTSASSKALPDIVLVTAATVLIFFVGWAYLNFYLRAFGILISELDLDIQTIFIYSYPPARLLLGTYYWWISIVIIFLLVTAVLVGRRLFGRPFALPIALALLMLIIFFSVPLIRWAALQTANLKWTSEGIAIAIEATVKEPETNKNWYENYQRCANRGGLDLIIADKESFYILCKSTVDKAVGDVYEIRRDVGLVSVRHVKQKQN